MDSIYLINLYFKLSKKCYNAFSAHPKLRYILHKTHNINLSCITRHLNNSIKWYSLHLQDLSSVKEWLSQLFSVAFLWTLSVKQTEEEEEKNKRNTDRRILVKPKSELCTATKCLSIYYFSANVNRLWWSILLIEFNLFFSDFVFASFYSCFKKEELLFP